MRPISQTISIDVPRERVFELLGDLSIRPSFTDHFITDYRLTRIEPVGVGAAARFHMAAARMWADAAIEAAEAPHLIRERGRGGRGNRTGVITVWELAEGPAPSSSEVTVTFWTEPATLADRLHDLRRSKRRLRRGWGRALKRLRELAEADAPAARVEVAGADRVPAFAR